MDSTDWRPADRANLDTVAVAVTAWLRYVPDSPLYRRLTSALVTDRRMLATVARIENTPPMNILFGAVKYLVRADDALGAWYPHLTDSPRAPDELAYNLFREFVLDHEEEIVRIGRTRRTQTNEIARSAAIFPWLAQAAQQWDQPAHAVDIGASAGLNLCLESFEFDYPGAHPHRVGDAGLALVCENRGGFPIPAVMPRFATRTGLDLNPLDVTSAADVNWLRALVWPEHRDRLARLDEAVSVRKRTPVTMIDGDAALTLRDLDATLAPGPMLIWHTVALYQFSNAQRRVLDDTIDDISRRRPVVRVGLEPHRDSGRQEVRVGPSFDLAATVAVADPHGRWIDRP